MLNTSAWMGNIAYSGYENDKNGFYAVYEKLFLQINDLERQALEDQDDPDFERPPVFGNKDLPYDQGLSE